MKPGLIGIVFSAAVITSCAAPDKFEPAADPLMAQVSSGEVRGSLAGDVATFKGIPFAKPPVGDLRWRAPQPVDRWDGTYEATDYGADCMQVPFAADAAPLRTEPAEDCLYVNVWKPASVLPGDNLPVLVWIYGGGWVNGGTSPVVYDGSATAQEGVVVVSFNYRLGRFGFFAHPSLSAADEDDGLFGNYGYMDQVAALEWVQENISAFGGAPDNVTIMGESAGGGSAVNLMTTDAARGLFQRAVVMSAPVRLDSFRKPLHASSVPDAESDGLAFAEWAGVPGQDEDTLSRLRALPAETVVAGTGMMSTPVAPASGPMIDGRILVGADGVLAAGTQQAVPVMVGAVSDDLGFGPDVSSEELFASYPDPEAARIAYDAFLADPAALRKAAYEDRFMQEPARFLADAQTDIGVSAYYYRYGYVPDSKKGEWSGMPHANEIPFFLNTVEQKYGDALTDADKAAADLVNSYLVNFVRSGDPNGEGLPAWPVHDPEAGRILSFSDDGATFVEDPRQARLDIAHAQAVSSQRPSP